LCCEKQGQCIHTAAHAVILAAPRDPGFLNAIEREPVCDALVVPALSRGIRRVSADCARRRAVVAGALLGLGGGALVGSARELPPIAIVLGHWLPKALFTATSMTGFLPNWFGKMTKTSSQEMPWWEVLWRYSLLESADSAWSLIVVSTYFGTFVQAVLHRPGAEFGWSITTASLAVALASPVLGAAADESGRRQPYLRVCVLGVALFTAALGFIQASWAALCCFMLAYIAANAAFTFFTAMLPAVTSERNVYAITGMTVSLGYIGGLVCLTLFGRLVRTDAEAGRVFLPMAAT
jgi:MFS/sugar transport protein